MRKRFIRFLLFAFLYAWFGRDGALGQTPDCKINFTFTATGRQPAAGFTNGTPSEPGCVTWTIVYYSTGFSALSLRLDSAPDASGVAGSWGAFGGTTLAGTNPQTTTTQNYFVGQGYFPWMSVNLTTVTGTGSIKGTAYGWKVPSQPYTSATITPAGTQDVNLIQVGGAAIALGQAAMAGSIPVVVASDQTNLPANLKAVGGTNIPALNGALPTLLGCPNSSDVALSGTGLTEIVAGVGGQTIYVCKVFVTSVSAGNPTVNTFTISRGTVSSCASPTQLALAGGVTGIDSDYGGALRSGSGQSICVSESVANSDRVTITYAIF